MIDKDSVIFERSRRLMDGVETEVQFQALKASDPAAGRTYYEATLLIDLLTRGVKGYEWRIANGQRPYDGPKDVLRDFEKVLRDLFLATEAWKKLSVATPNPNIFVDELGCPIAPAPPLNRRV